MTHNQTPWQVVEDTLKEMSLPHDDYIKWLQGQAESDKSSLYWILRLEAAK